MGNLLIITVIISVNFLTCQGLHKKLALVCIVVAFFDALSIEITALKFVSQYMHFIMNVSSW